MDLTIGERLLYLTPRPLFASGIRREAQDRFRPISESSQLGVGRQ
jgi:hypothetical protein